MGFVHQYKDVIPLGENRIFLTLVVIELVYQRKEHRFVASQVLTQLHGVFRLALLFVANHFRTNESLVYLRV